MTVRMKPDVGISLIERVPSYSSEVEKRLSPIELLETSRPAVFISVGRGELGLSVAFHEDIEEAGSNEVVTHFAEKQMFYGGS